MPTKSHSRPIIGPASPICSIGVNFLNYNPGVTHNLFVHGGDIVTDAHVLRNLLSLGLREAEPRLLLWFYNTCHIDLYEFLRLQDRMTDVKISAFNVAADMRRLWSWNRRQNQGGDYQGK